MSPMSLFRPASGNDAHGWTSMEEADVTSTVVPMHDRVAPRAARSIEPLVVGLIAIVFAGWRLAQQGLGNSYYTAADISGARSVHNLFFAAFDRTGIMAVDKPPLGLVAPAAAVHAFGVSSWSVLGPQVVMFGIGLALLHAAMRRWFSARAARIASLVMVLIPIDIVVARSNNPDELLTLFTIIGLIAAVEAMRDGHGRWVALCAAAVSLGFLTKFLQAFVGLPVLAAAVFFSVRGHRRLTRTAWFGITRDGVSTAAIKAAVVVLDRTDHLPLTGPVSWRTVALHELAHAMGLDHAGSSKELMYPVLSPTLTGLQAGDLEGLRRVGQAAGCTTV